VADELGGVAAHEFLVNLLRHLATVDVERAELDLAGGLLVVLAGGVAHEKLARRNERHLDARLSGDDLRRSGRRRLVGAAATGDGQGRKGQDCGGRS
jgi:hypothetical protein